MCFKLKNKMLIKKIDNEGYFHAGGMKHCSKSGYDKII